MRLLLFVLVNLILLPIRIMVMIARAIDAPPSQEFRPHANPYKPNRITQGRARQASARLPEVRSVLRGAAYVIDGDSLIIRHREIRLFGVDAPEMKHPYGRQAKWALLSLCRGKTVHAQIIAQDHYGRTVARCLLDDGRDLSAEMVKLGLALDWPKFSEGVYRALETPDARRKLWLADARQKGRMDVWEQFERQQSRSNSAHR